MIGPTDAMDLLHPLKQLRTTIGISQQAFAEITGIRLDTVRALEIRRRAQGELSDEQLEMILLSIGALWHKERAQWFFPYVQQDGKNVWVPYRREHYQTFMEELKAEAHERAGLTYCLLLRLLGFIDNLPSRAVNGWFWRLTHYLDEWGAKEIPFELSPQWDKSEARVLGYRKIFRSLLQGEEQKFSDLIDKVREERETQRKTGIFDEPEPVEEIPVTAKPTKSVPHSPRRPAAG